MTPVSSPAACAQRAIRPKLLASVLLAAASLLCTSGYAATIGHSRLVSRAGEPLRIDVPLSQLSADDAASLQVKPAAAAQWAAAGLRPPVDLASLQWSLSAGPTPGTHVIRIYSDERLEQPIADLLLDLHMGSGVQRYQVSLLAQGAGVAVQTPADSLTDGAVTPASRGATGTPGFDRQVIPVRRGDTMFAIARRHAVEGVSIYQMMIALQRANPEAFIQGNLNLVRAGAQLVMPEHDALTAITDREARRLFHEQVLAFQRFGRSAGAVADVAAGAVVSAPHETTEPAQLEQPSNLPAASSASGDVLRLSSGHERDTGADATGRSGAAESASAIVSGIARNAHAATTDDVRPDASVAGAASNDVAPASGTGDAGAAPVPSAAQGGTGRSGKSGASAGPATSRSQQAEAGPSQSQHAEAGSSRQQPAGAAGNEVDDGSMSDDRQAIARAIDDAQDRVSQLEENVRNLNLALQSQGEAAKDLVIDSAVGLRQSLAEVARAVTEATIGDEEPGDTSPSTADQTGAPVDGKGAADAAGDTTASDAETDRSEAGLAGTAALTSTGSQRAAGDEKAVPPAEKPADHAQATAQDEPGGSAAAIAWIQDRLLGVIAGGLAVLVLLIAWLLRRYNQAQSRTDAAVTPEMVREKLSQINLDLADSESTDRTPPAG